MTLKKIYACLALLFCAPTVLLSTQKQSEEKYALVGVQTKNKGDSNKEDVYAVFASTSLSGLLIWNALKESKNEVYKDNIKNLLLYTNKKTDGEAIWNKGLADDRYAKEFDRDDSRENVQEQDEDDLISTSLSKVAEKDENGGFNEKYTFKGEDLEKACEAWDKEEEPTGIDLPQGEFSNVYENTSSVNNKILIIHATKTDPQYEVVEKKCLAIQIVNGKKFALLEEKGLSITIQDLKQKIQEKKGIPVEQQRFIFKGRQLEDVRKLEDYGIKLHQTIYLVNRGERSNNQNFNDEQKSNSLDNTDDEDDSAEEVTLGKVALFYACAVTIIAGIVMILEEKALSIKKNKKTHTKKKKA